MTVTATTIADKARNLLRDFPQFFEVPFQGPLQATLRLPTPLVSDVRVLEADGTVNDTVTVDERNGLVKFPGQHAGSVVVQGYNYEWFLPSDLEFFANFVSLEHLYYNPELTLNDLRPEEHNVIAMGTVVYALWSLMTEFSTQIDVSSPEGMMIPAHQRFQQIQQMLAVWQQRYTHAAAMLNVGLNRIDVRTLRRISRTTNRYVPLFEGRELDDPRPPIRSFPHIDPIDPDQPTDDAAPAGSLGEFGITGEGWMNLGTTG